MGATRLRGLGCGFVAAALFMGAAACGSDDEGAGSGGATTTAPVVVTPRDFSERGPFAVGAVRVAIDEQRPVEVFYPVDADAVPGDAQEYRYTPEEVWGDLLAALPPDTVKTMRVPGAWFDLPASDGPFPVVVISHGVGMKRFTYALHAAHVASWGYIVAAPEQPVRNMQARLAGTQTTESDVDTILDTVALLEAETGRSGSVLDGSVDIERVAVEGHSAGGRDAALSAYEEIVDTWIGLAPGLAIPDEAVEGRNIFAEWEYGLDTSAGEFDFDKFLETSTPPDKPSMMIVAADDIILPTPDRLDMFEWLPAPKRFVVLENTGHTVFVNECRGIQERGYSAVARALGWGPDAIERQLLEDGCLKAATRVEDIWGVWRHLVIAQLNSVFGIDVAVADASLEKAYLDVTFEGLITRYLVAE